MSDKHEKQRVADDRNKANRQRNSLIKRIDDNQKALSEGERTKPFNADNGIDASNLDHHKVCDLQYQLGQKDLPFLNKVSRKMAKFSGSLNMEKYYANLLKLVTSVDSKFVHDWDKDKAMRPAKKRVIVKKPRAKRPKPDDSGSDSGRSTLRKKIKQELGTVVSYQREDDGDGGFEAKLEEVKTRAHADAADIRVPPAESSEDVVAVPEQKSDIDLKSHSTPSAAAAADDDDASSHKSTWSQWLKPSQTRATMARWWKEDSCNAATQVCEADIDFDCARDVDAFINDALAVALTPDEVADMV